MVLNMVYDFVGKGCVLISRISIFGREFGIGAEIRKLKV